MDPNATLRWIQDELDSGRPKGDYIQDLYRALRTWLDSEGFEPDWDKYPEAADSYSWYWANLS